MKPIFLGVLSPHERSIEARRRIARRFLTVFVCLSVMLVAGCEHASGSAIVTGTRRPPISPDAVKIYIDAPAEYETIGLVHAQFQTGAMREAAKQEIAMKELKKQAAALGANGILLTAVGSNDAMVGAYGRGFLAAGSVSMPELSSRAIFVNK
jgi:uncharacterized protein YbjQ (UPF0145 family)